MNSSSTSSITPAKSHKKREIKIPQVMIENEIDAYIHDMEHRLSHQGFNLEGYLGLIGKTMEEMRKEYAEKAEKNVKTRLVLEAIFEKEELEVTDDDINAKLEEFAKAYGRDTAEFVKNANEQTNECSCRVVQPKIIAVHDLKLIYMFCHRHNLLYR